MAMRLSELTSYPLKSGGACSHTTASVHTRGLQWDRRWMLVDAEGSFLTARAYPRLLLLKPTLDAFGHLTLSDPSGRRLENIPPTTPRNGRYSSGQIDAKHSVSMDI